MRDKLNCPNCGAPITGTECQYCGSVFYDFVTLDDSKPTYVRVRLFNDQIVTAKVLVQSATVNIEPDALPTIDIALMVVPDDNGITATFSHN